MHKDSEIKKSIEANQLDSIKTRLSDADYLAKKTNDKSRYLYKAKGADKYNVVNDLKEVKKEGRALIFAEVSLPKEEKRMFPSKSIRKISEYPCSALKFLRSPPLSSSISNRESLSTNASNDCPLVS